jgi:large subunit ribosomal protein L6
MSRVGKKPILIPENVEVKVEGQKVTIKGPKGELSREIRSEIKVELKDNQIFIFPVEETKKTKAFWGLTRALLANMIKGVKEGYEKRLEIEGVGFKVSVEGEDLKLFVGFTHPVTIKAPQNIKFSAEKNVITVSGIDKEKVGQISATIRRVNPPEPYKGKGIRYQGEIVRRKVGKKAVTTM